MKVFIKSYKFLKSYIANKEDLKKAYCNVDLDFFNTNDGKPLTDEDLRLINNRERCTSDIVNSANCITIISQPVTEEAYNELLSDYKYINTSDGVCETANYKPTEDTCYLLEHQHVGDMYCYTEFIGLENTYIELEDVEIIDKYAVYKDSDGMYYYHTCADKRSNCIEVMHQHGLSKKEVEKELGITL